MKSTFLLILTGISFLCIKCNDQPYQINPGKAVTKQLQALLDQKEYFLLETKLNSFKDSIDDRQKLYFRSFTDNAFNRNVASVQDVDLLLKKYSSTFADSVKAALILLQGDSYFKLFQYAKAAQNSNRVLNNYAGVLDSEKISDIKNDLLIRSALQNVPPQETTIYNSTVIHWKKDRIGLVEIPVTSNGKTYDAIFDTRANISSISKTYAITLGLRMLDVSYEEGSGITGIRFKTGLGIADSMYIGNVLIRNALFQVMPDSILYIAPVQFSLHIIVGYPIIAALKEVHIYKDGKMLIPQVPSKKEIHNFALDGLDPVISLKTDSDTLCFHLDLGASSTDLYYAYFEKFKSQILKKGIVKTIQIGGAGGVQKKEVYVLPEFNVYLGDKKITIDSVDVHKERIYPGERFYGNLGQDFTSAFNELILNFSYMYITGN